MLQFVVVDEAGLAPYREGLRALERSISYPVSDGDDTFFIDHGPNYHDFFCRMGEKTRFLVVLEDDRVVGSLVGVWREADFAGIRRTGLYFCDLKLDRSLRGRRVAQRIFWYVLWRWPVRRDFQGWRFLYFAAMQGERGDVARSFRGWHLGKIVRPISRQWLYFVPVSQLADLADGGPVPPGGRGLDFSPDNIQIMESTHGRKDLRLHSTGEPWPLVHIPCGPQHWDAPLGTFLQRCGRQMSTAFPEGLACFGLDERLQEHTSWLEQRGLSRGARCVIYGFSIPGWAPRMRQYDWVHLATSEI